jgi:hypothetical protein
VASHLEQNLENWDHLAPRFRSWNPEIGRIFEIGRQEISHQRWHAAAELFSIVVEHDNIFEFGFLALSVANWNIGNLELARRFADQASVVSKFVGSDNSADLYSRYVQAMKNYECYKGTLEFRRKYTNPGIKPDGSEREKYCALPYMTSGTDWDHWPLAGVPEYGPMPTPPWDQKISGPRNRHGYRADSLDIRKRLNVLSLGCSWSEGWNVDCGEAWPAALPHPVRAVWCIRQ